MRFRKIYINSSHRTSGTSTGFHYQLAVDQDCSGECACAVTSICLPNSLYSVMQNVNDKIYIYEKHTTTESLSQNRILTIAAGNYSSTTLNAAGSRK